MHASALKDVRLSDYLRLTCRQGWQKYPGINGKMCY